MTMGDLLTWMVLIGSRVTPSGSSSCLVNMRRRMASAFSDSSSSGETLQSQTMSSFLLVGCGASGHTIAMQPRSGPYMPEMCRKGRPTPISSHTACLLRSFRQKSHSLGWAWRSLRASATVARTSDSASCAASWTMPLATVRCSSLKLGRPSSCWGHSKPSGRKA